MATDLYPDDVVVATDDPSKVGEVLLIHDEADAGQRFLPWEHGGPGPTKDTSVSSAQLSSLLRNKVPPKGTVLVRWNTTNNTKDKSVDAFELIRTSCLQAYERPLYSGDVVKRKVGDAMSGVVLTTKTFCSLQPVQEYETSTGRTLHGLRNVNSDVDDPVQLQHSPAVLREIPVSDLDLAQEYNVGDLVIFGDWIGHIDFLVQGYTLLLSNNTLVELTEMDENEFWHYDVTVGDVLHTKKGRLRKGRWILGQYDPSIQPTGVLVAARVVLCGIEWLHRRVGSALSSSPDKTLDRTALESEQFCLYNRAKPPADGLTSENVTLTETEVSFASRVRFADILSACEKYNYSRLPRTTTAGYDLNVFDVLRTRKQVRIMWQDLSTSEHDSTELVPDLTMDDEHSAWPGEIAHSLDLNPVPDLPNCFAPSKVGVIQSVKADERLAAVRWCPAATLQYAVDEVTHEVADPNAPKTLVQSVIGVCSGPIEEVSLYDVDAPGELNVRRGDVVLINDHAMARLNAISGVNWLGEIVQEHLDGTLLIRLGAALPVQDIVLKREEVTIAIRSDDPDLDDDYSDTHDFDDPMDTDDFTDSDDFTDTSDDGGSVISLTMREVTYEDENGELLDESEVDNDDWESASELDVGTLSGTTDTDAVAMEEHSMSRSPHVVPPTLQTKSEAAFVDEASCQDTTDSVAQYTLKDGPVPTDHHFAAESSVAGSSLRRVQKEHRILQKPGAIPDGVYVTSWESRLDLLRVLFVGPQDTPYVSSPFVIDFWMPPAFPSEPPRAFFHSWAGESALGGTGRVNPNLYEDGTICLSLLGTWSGEKQENWNADGSTLLQIVVSVLGLVLVSEPYFNEAGYEHLAGTEAARRPSMLYNERTSLRALNFVIAGVSAVQQNRQLAGLGDIEGVVQWLYLTPGGPLLLSRVHEHVRAVLERSEESKGEADGTKVLSHGACIPLRRILGRLEHMLST